MPMDDIITAVILFSIICAPALAFSFRIALKPAVEALVRLREETVLPEAGADRETSDLRRRVEELQDRLERLEEARDFDRQLRGGDGNEEPATG